MSYFLEVLHSVEELKGMINYEEDMNNNRQTI